MNTFLTRPPAERRRLCEDAGAVLKLRAASVEKDFWVCWTLRELFALPDFGPRLTFKGGTSLSKGWKLIERFSEDIDLVLDREFLGFAGEKKPEEAPSNKKREERLESLRTACQAAVQKKILPALESIFKARYSKDLNGKLEVDPDDEDQQTLLFHYPSVFPAGAYVRPAVKIELGARSDTDPSETPKIEPYIAEILPGEFKDASFAPRTVAPERTFWEKAMLLHEETYREGDGPKSRQSRHYYDLWCLIRRGVAEKALAAEGLFQRVADHRKIFFRRGKDAQDSLKPGSLRLLPREEHESAWKRDYDAMREGMFFTEPPAFDEIMSSVGDFERRFNGN